MIKNGYKGIEVEIIEYTKHPAKIIWDMLKQTWISLHDVKYDENSPVVKEFINESLAKRLNPVPQETILIQCVFKRISRVCLAQITRQRGWIFNSESQMPQATKHDVCVPLNIVNSKYYERFMKLAKESEELYNDMIKGNENKNTTNIPYQDARYCLLNGQTTDLSASFTLPQFINCCGMRLENNTHDEINYLCRLVIKELRKSINNDDELDNLDKLVYNTLLDNCDAFGANRKASTCCDAMFGNSYKRYPDANEYVTKATESCLLDYKKLAWTYELKRINKEEPELLLPDEKEMIEKWG